MLCEEYRSFFSLLAFRIRSHRFYATVFGAVDSTLETVYPHFEPLKEWKMQAFVKGDQLTLEIVTYEDWIAVGRELLVELADIMDLLVNRPNETLFQDDV